MPLEADDRIADILERFILADEAGEDVDLAELCGGDPEIERTIRRLLDLDATLGPSLDGVGDDDDDESELDDSEVRNADLPFKELGEFRLVAAIGSGASGRVYVAEQGSLGRIVALKVFDPIIAAEDGARRFQREAEIAGALHHPNIVPIFGVGEDSGHHYIAMRWLTGPSLSEAAPIEPRRVAEIGVPIAEALDRAHHSGVVHRDVKPANILLDDDQPFLVDFGLAHSRSHATLTREGVVPGTLPYVAPELLRGSPPDASTDVYALGATLYECLVGTPPFDDDEPEVLIRRVLFRDPPRLGLDRSHRDLETIVLRCLEKERHRRLESCADVAAELRRFLDGQPIQSRHSGLLDRAGKLVRRNRKTAAMLGAASFVIVVLTGLYFLKLRDDQREKAHTLDQVESALRGWDLELAGALLERIEDSRDHRWATLRGRATAMRDLRRLLDEIHTTSAYEDVEGISDLVRRLVGSGATSEDLRLAHLAVAAAALHRGDPELTRERLDDLDARWPPGLASAGLRAALEADRDWAPDLGAASPTADDHVFASVALRLLGRSPSASAAQLAKAYALDPGHDRTHLGLALDRMIRGDHATALLALRLLRQDGVTRIALERAIATAQIMTGDLTGARRTLDGIPVDDRGPKCAVLELLLLRREGKLDEADAYSLVAEQRYGHSGVLLLRLARHAQLRFDDPRARALLIKARDSGGSSRLRDQVTVELLTCDLRDLGAEDPMQGLPLDGIRNDVRQIGRDAAAIAKQTLSPVARSGALWLEAWAQRLITGDRTNRGSLDLLRRAIEADPTNLIPRTDFMQIVLTLALPPSNQMEAVSHDPKPLAPEIRGLIDEASTHCARILEHAEAGRSVAMAAQVFNAYQALAVFHWARGDHAACLTAARAAKERAVDQATGPLTALIGWAER